MKILMVLEGEFPPDERVEKEAVSLIDAGHKVYLICYTKTNRKEQEEYKKINIYRKPISKFIYKSSIGCLRFPYYFNFWRSFLHGLLKNESFDAIHIHDLPLVQVGLEIKIKYKIPLIFDMHENYPAFLETAIHVNTFPGNLFYSRKKWRKYEKESVYQCDHIITVVEEMKERIKKLGFSGEKITVLSNTPAKRDLKIHKNTPDKNYLTLFYTGGLNSHRGLQIVIRGIRLIVEQYPNIRLWIVGTGSFKTFLERLTNRLDLENYIHFFGRKEQDDMFGLLIRSDIALIPHLKSEQTDNSSPNKLFQYMLMGKPIISSNCNSIERIINEAGTGIIYYSNSAESFAMAVQKMIGKGDLDKQGVAGQKLVKDKYNWETSVEELLNMYNQY
jgi:glycosyltransferase involved in cell wall biosynthesis